jgi:hypothetical protein
MVDNMAEVSQVVLKKKKFKSKEVLRIAKEILNIKKSQKINKF